MKLWKRTKTGWLCMRQKSGPAPAEVCPSVWLDDDDDPRQDNWKSAYDTGVSDGRANPFPKHPTCRDIAQGLGADQAKAMGIPMSDEPFSEWQKRRKPDTADKFAQARLDAAIPPTRTNREMLVTHDRAIAELKESIRIIMDRVNDESHAACSSLNEVDRMLREEITRVEKDHGSSLIRLGDRLTELERPKDKPAEELPQPIPEGWEIIPVGELKPEGYRYRNLKRPWDADWSLGSTWGEVVTPDSVFTYIRKLPDPTPAKPEAWDAEKYYRENEKYGRVNAIRVAYAAGQAAERERIALDCKVRFNAILAKIAEEKGMQ